MSPREWRLRIDDMLGAIGCIQGFTSGMDFEAFCSDLRTVHAVVLNLAIIGEAANHVPLEIQTRHGNVPWAQMRGLRNVIVHHYFGVDLVMVWRTARHRLPELARQLHELLEAER